MYRDLFVYILVLYVRLHTDFGVQSQYSREQLMLPSYYNCFNFVVRLEGVFSRYELCDMHLIYGEAMCVAREAVRLYQLIIRT